MIMKPASRQSLDASSHAVRSSGITNCGDERGSNPQQNLQRNCMQISSHEISACFLSRFPGYNATTYSASQGTGRRDVYKSPS